MESGRRLPIAGLSLTLFVHGSAVDVPIGPIVAGVEGGEVLPLGEGGGPAAHLHNKTITSPNKV